MGLKPAIELASYELSVQLEYWQSVYIITCDVIYGSDQEPTLFICKPNYNPQHE